MGFHRYRRTRVGADATRYTWVKDINLFGINVGIIPELLKPKIPRRKGEPYEWHLDIRRELDAHPTYRRSSLVIDLKPAQHPTNVSLYEVLDVWGRSEADWSPILLRLAGLFVDVSPRGIDSKCFVRKDSDIDQPIYEVLHMYGSVQSGRLSGTWTAPGPTSLNAALLWPATLRYFVASIRACTPDVLPAPGDTPLAPQPPRRRGT
jgi:hypothetical protein